ncbi:hypothetical protein BKA69DRAFT_99831 [Paraphysoderma sedebokerense]|nr:hypothetical protein BKA69DRAFT_99831 [Paraphysoderma sedebokerense]
MADIIAPAIKALQPVVQPIIGKKCFKSLLLDFDYTDVPCLKLFLSKGLGIGIVVFGAIVKVPQILKILSSKSAAGLSFPAYVLESLAAIITVAYNVNNKNPFNTYGETAFICFQNIIIMLLMGLYRRQYSLSYLTLVSSFAASYVLFASNLIQPNVLQYLQGLTIPLSISSKIPQIFTIYKEGHTGQLSAFTIFAFFAGSVARVFTTMQEVNDGLILLSFALTSILNAVLVLQLMYYWNVKPVDAKKKTA